MKRKKSRGILSYFSGYMSARSLRDLHVLLFLIVIIAMWMNTYSLWVGGRSIVFHYQIHITVLWFILLCFHTYIVRLINQRDQLRDELEAMQQYTQQTFHHLADEDDTSDDHIVEFQQHMQAKRRSR